MTDMLSVEEKAALLGVEAWPDGHEWVCSDGHRYPEGFEPDRCPADGLPLTRALLALRVGK